jgi:hypothetical protein
MFARGAVQYVMPKVDFFCTNNYLIKSFWINEVKSDRHFIDEISAQILILSALFRSVTSKPFFLSVSGSFRGCEWQCVAGEQ